MNVIIGVIVDNTMQASQSCDQDNEVADLTEKLQQIEMIIKEFIAFDEDGNGSVSMKEAAVAMESKKVVRYMRDLRLPVLLQPQDFIDFLDTDGDSNVQEKEMEERLTRLLVHTPSQNK